MSWIFRRPHDYRAQLGRSLFALLAVASATSGSADIAFSATGTLAGDGALAGTSSNTLTATVAPLEPNLSGTAGMLMDGTAVPTATGNLAGAAALTFSNSGTMTGSAAVPLGQRFKPARWRAEEIRYSRQLDKLVIFPFSEPTGASGQSDIIFTPTATLNGTGPFVGVSSNTLTATGTLSGTGDLLGSAALTFTPEGTVTGTAAGDITGVAAIAFDASASLYGVGALAGVSANAFDATLQPGSIQPLAGTAELTVTVNGNLVASQPPRRTPRGRTVYVNTRSRR